MIPSGMIYDFVQRPSRARAYMRYTARGRVVAVLCGACFCCRVSIAVTTRPKKGGWCWPFSAFILVTCVSLSMLPRCCQGRH